MKVILLQSVSNLGKADEVKEVAEGYARNFLFPKHLAVLASAQAVEERAARQKKQVKDSERELREQQAMVERIDGHEVELKEKINKANVLYAAVTAAKVAAALKAKGFEVAPQQIILKPIKSVGSFPVKLKFRHGLEAEIVVNVGAAE